MGRDGLIDEPRRPRPGNGNDYSTILLRVLAGFFRRRNEELVAANQMLETANGKIERRKRQARTENAKLRDYANPHYFAYLTRRRLAGVAEPQIEVRVARFTAQGGVGR